jgi:hypothetical protein
MSFFQGYSICTRKDKPIHPVCIAFILLTQVFSRSVSGFNSSVPRTFTFLEEPTPKRRGSAMEREEMASLTQDHSPTSPGYLFPDEESPRRPVADVEDQSWAHVRTAVAQAKRTRSMTTASSRDASRSDPLR